MGWGQGETINKNWAEPDYWKSDCGKLLAVAKSAWSNSQDVWIELDICLWQVPLTHSPSHEFQIRVSIKIPIFETEKTFDQDEWLDECLFRWNSTSPTIEAELSYMESEMIR